MSKGTEIASDVAALLRARNPLFWVITKEEGRVERLLIEAAMSVKYVPYTWDCGQGTADAAGNVQSRMGDGDPATMLNYIKSNSETGKRSVWIMRDLPVWLEGPIGMTTLRKLRNLARSLPKVEQDRAQAIIIITPSSRIPDELANHTTVIEWPLPDREEIAALLDSAIAALPEGIRDSAAPNGTRDAAVDAAMGLSGEEAAAAFSRSLVQVRKIDPTMIANEKKRVVAREGVLEWYDPIKGGLDAVGGLDNLKAWLSARRMAYSAKARAYGLPPPKGVFLVGIAGCGKSMTAKATATAYNVPLLKLDLGALKGKFVGQSEGNLRKALSVIKAIGRCVVWLDEIEKSLAGATQGAADGGVSADALGAILTWMQERQGEAFVVATANDVQALPPELLRKGRFDEVWWIDLPNIDERMAIVNAAVRANGRDPVSLGIDAAIIAFETDGFTGAEIAALVPDALFKGFADGSREITTADLLGSAKLTTPLSRTASEKITALREWSVGRARHATSGEVKQKRTTEGRQLDL